MKKHDQQNAPSAHSPAERGIALLMTLGILGLLLVMAMSFSYTARLETMASEVNTDMIRARLMANSGLERVMGFIRQSFAGQQSTTGFFAPGSGDWDGMAFIASINDTNKSGIANALGVSFYDGTNNYIFTPSTSACDADYAGWIEIRSKRKIFDLAGDDTDVIIGRMAYLVLEDTGKLDPSGVVCLTTDEATGAAKLGASESEIALADFSGIAAIADSFRSASAAGSMPNPGRWNSISHLARKLNPSVAQMSTIVRQLRPHSAESDQFWNPQSGAGWLTGTSYLKFDIITHNGVDYMCIAAHTSAAVDEPGIGDDWKNYWSTEKYTDRLNLTPTPWQLNTNYKEMDMAANINNYYICTVAHLSAAENAPGVGGLWTNYWQPASIYLQQHLLRSEWLEHNWSTGVNFSTGGVVKHNNNYYICKTAHTSPVLVGPDDVSKPGEGAQWTAYWQLDPLAREIAAAQVAVNMIDYMDTDSTPTVLWLNAAGDLLAADPGIGNYKLKVRGVEKEWGIEEIATRVSVQETVTDGEVELKVGFKTDLYHPLASQTFGGTLDISYSITLNSGLNSTSSSGTVSIANADLTYNNFGGGTLAHTAAYKENTSTHTGFLDVSKLYIIQDFKINSVIIKDGSAVPLLTLPYNAYGSNPAPTFWANVGVTESTVAAVKANPLNSYAWFRASDPLQNQRDDADADFAVVNGSGVYTPVFWTRNDGSATFPKILSLPANPGTDASAIGSMPAGYDTADYCDVEVKDAPFTRVGELGRVHSATPMRSLRLWSSVVGDLVGHDAHILDLFKIGTQTTRYGRVNVNGSTKDNEVLKALGTGVFSNTTTAANTIVANQPYSNLGDLFGGKSGGTTQDLYVSASSYTKPQDKEAEEGIVQKLAELVATRYNYYTVIVFAQAIQDIGPVPKPPDYDDEITVDGVACQLNRYDHGGDKILAEHKLLAVLRRDINTNEVSIIHTETLYE